MEYIYEFPPTGSILLLFGMIFLAGFVDSVAGGGGLISQPAYLLSGLPIHCALGCNKVSSACGTLVATVQYFRSGVLDWRVAGLSAVCSFIGSAGGARVALLIDDDTLKMALIILLPIVSIIILAKRNLADENLSEQLTRKQRWFFGAFIGLFIGFYDGLIGPGTGTFAMMAYCILMKYDMRTASGNARMLNLASNVAAAVTFASAGTVVYKVALPAAVFGILGGYLGSKVAIRRGAKFIRPVMIVVLIMIMVNLVVDVFF